jgi:hypothetical protein
MEEARREYATRLVARGQHSHRTGRLTTPGVLGLFHAPLGTGGAISSAPTNMPTTALWLGRAAVAPAQARLQARVVDSGVAVGRPGLLQRETLAPHVTRAVTAAQWQLDLAPALAARDT